MAYTKPCNARISSTWANHKTRRPPSTEPGTDYACAYGTNLVAAGAGRVVDVKTSNSKATGRYVTIDLDDGRRVRYLHLSVVGVKVGARVKAGTYIGKSGGSANGNNWGVGAHVHVTLWAKHAYSFGSNATLDFEKYVNGSSGGGVSQDVKNRQSWLNKSRGEKLVVDGLLGSATKAAIKRYQQFLKTNYGYKDAVDGIWGKATQAAHQKYYDVWNAPKPPAPTKLVVDGKWGADTTKALQTLLKVAVDGKYGQATRKALQVALNAKPFDGLAGPITNKALQTFLKQGGYYAGNIDGEIGVESIKGLQRFLNTGKPFTPVKVVNEPKPVTTKPATKTTPVLPFADEGWDSPKGREKRASGSKITALAVHHTANLANQEAYFKGTTGSIPTWYVNGKKIIEFTRPGLRPVTTANSNNWTVSIETQNIKGEPNWEVSNESIENIAQIAAWLHSYNGKTLDGIPVEFTLDREHIKGHKEFAGNATACPGPYLYGKLDAIVSRAKQIYEAEYAPKPTEPPVEPVAPEEPETPAEDRTEPPTTPEGFTLVKTSTLKNIQTHLKALQIVVDNLIGEK